MFDVSPEGANFWFDISNAILLLGAVLVAVGTFGAIKLSGVKEKFSDERIAANEAETKRAVAESDAAKEGTARANERIAELSTQAELLRKDTAEANKVAAEAQLALEKFKAPRTLSDEQISRIKEKVKFFEGQHFSIITYWNIEEPVNFAKRIGDDALIASGWVYDKPLNGETFVGVFTGVKLAISDQSPEIAIEAAKALSSALEDEGITVPIINEPTYKTFIKLEIGIKP